LPSQEPGSNGETFSERDERSRLAQLESTEGGAEKRGRAGGAFDFHRRFNAVEEKVANPERL
jgi:hypothetical protein